MRMGKRSDGNNVRQPWADLLYTISDVLKACVGGMAASERVLLADDVRHAMTRSNDMSGMGEAGQWGEPACCESG
jgi:hypothetical protein